MKLKFTVPVLKLRVKISLDNVLLGIVMVNALVLAAEGPPMPTLHTQH